MSLVRQTDCVVWPSRAVAASPGISCPHDFLTSWVKTGSKMQPKYFKPGVCMCVLNENVDSFSSLLLLWYLTIILRLELKTIYIYIAGYSLCFDTLFTWVGGICFGHFSWGFRMLMLCRSFFFFCKLHIRQNFKISIWGFRDPQRWDGSIPCHQLAERTISTVG